MTNKKDFETYLYVEDKKFTIFLLNTGNFKNIYFNEIILNENFDLNFEELSKFLDDNIFKIEKLLGTFIEDIFLIIENKVELQTLIGIKKKNNNIFDQTILNQALVDLKDLFRESNKDQHIIHMLIENFIIDGKNHNLFTENLKSDYFNLDVKFITLPHEFIFRLNKLLEKYQIKAKYYISGKYLKGFINEECIEISLMAHKIINGYNVNEIEIVPKTRSNKGFFEKFFQFFS
jgi:hypothetical protein|tara:strand:+ start:449 stop:1147 length:699 start_codon:yes stop_codon:yes gene_type:complete